MPSGQHQPSRKSTSGFVTTHCRICAAGQTITREDGKKATYCLLMREWTTSKLGHPLVMDCDRYEERFPAGEPNHERGSKP